METETKPTESGPEMTDAPIQETKSEPETKQTLLLTMEESKEFERPSIPTGIYSAVFKKFAQFESTFEGQKQQRLALEFEIIDGNNKGTVVTHYCSPKLTRRTKLYAVFCALRGDEGPQLNEKVDLGKHIGTEVKIVTETKQRKTDKGLQPFSTVATVVNKAMT